MRPLGALLFPGLFLRLAATTPHELGAAAERYVARRLARAGWRILARRLATRALEVDLVAADGDELVLIEVKAGRLRAPAGIRDRGAPRPLERVDPTRRQALAAAARELGRRLGAGNPRVDLIEVLVRRRKLVVTHERGIGRVGCDGPSDPVPRSPFPSPPP